MENKESVKTIKCKDFADFVNEFSYGGKYFFMRMGNYIFRGEGSDEYELMPSALRKDNEKTMRKLIEFLQIGQNDSLSEYYQEISELLCLKDFFKTCDFNGLYVPEIEDFRSNLTDLVNIDDVLRTKEDWLPLEYIELAGLAQHYGMPTRLLDWSQDLYVALYFATSGAMKLLNDHLADGPKNMVLWAFDLDRFLLKKEDYKREIKYKDSNLEKILIRIPRYNSNPNLCAQKGVFTLFQIDNPVTSGLGDNPKNTTPFNELIEQGIQDINYQPILYRILIPSVDCYKLYGYLKMLGYSASKLFPGYGGVAKTFNQDNKIYKE
jgi:hypothetical protein